jgi:hypothetical protein
VIKTGGAGRGEICGVVVDRKSGLGGVTEVIGKPAIKTGPKEAGYEYLAIQPGEICWTWGSGAVLYIKHA